MKVSGSICTRSTEVKADKQDLKDFESEAGLRKILAIIKIIKMEAEDSVHTTNFLKQKFSFAKNVLDNAVHTIINAHVRRKTESSLCSVYKMILQNHCIKDNQRIPLQEKKKLRDISGS